MCNSFSCDFCLFGLALLYSTKVQTCKTGPKRIINFHMEARHLWFTVKMTFFTHTLLNFYNYLDYEHGDAERERERRHICR